MKKACIIFFFLLVNFIAVAQQQNLQYYYSQAREAYKAGDHARFYDMIIKANERHPYHQGIMYYRGIAAALTSRPEESVQFLREAVLVNAAFDLTLKDLQVLSGQQDFEALKVLQQELQKNIVHADTAWVMKDRSLHLETIAAGEKQGTYYLSSVHQRKVVKVDHKGKTSDFTKTAQDGMTAILGIKIDQKKKLLWVCSSPMPEMVNFDTLSVSAIFKYDLNNGKLLDRYTPQPSSKEFVFGDLLLSNDGEVFISDTQNNTLYTVNEATHSLESYFTSQEFWNIQGITFSADERFLFISDYIKGIFRLDIQTKELIQLKKEPMVSLKSIDGLLWYQNSLIAIQNGVDPMRVTRYFLNSALDTITRFEIIDRGHPAFNEPTNGCIIGDTLYYVANSQWGGYDDKHQLKPLDQLQDIVILKADLTKIK